MSAPTSPSSSSLSSSPSSSSRSVSPSSSDSEREEEQQRRRGKDDPARRSKPHSDASADLDDAVDVFGLSNGTSHARSSVDSPASTSSSRGGRGQSSQNTQEAATAAPSVVSLFDPFGLDGTFDDPSMTPVNTRPRGGSDSVRSDSFLKGLLLEGEPTRNTHTPTLSASEDEEGGESDRSVNSTPSSSSRSSRRRRINTSILPVVTPPPPPPPPPPSAVRPASTSSTSSPSLLFSTAVPSLDDDGDIFGLSSNFSSFAPMDEHLGGRSALLDDLGPMEDAEVASGAAAAADAVPVLQPVTHAHSAYAPSLSPILEIVASPLSDVSTQATPTPAEGLAPPLSEEVDSIPSLLDTDSNPFENPEEIQAIHGVSLPTDKDSNISPAPLVSALDATPAADQIESDLARDEATPPVSRKKEKKRDKRAAEPAAASGHEAADSAQAPAATFEPEQPSPSMNGIEEERTERRKKKEKKREKREANTDEGGTSSAMTPSSPALSTLSAAASSTPASPSPATLATPPTDEPPVPLSLDRRTSGESREEEQRRKKEKKQEKKLRSQDSQEPSDSFSPTPSSSSRLSPFLSPSATPVSSAPPSSESLLAPALSPSTPSSASAAAEVEAPTEPQPQPPSVDTTERQLSQEKGKEGQQEEEQEQPTEAERRAEAKRARKLEKERRAREAAEAQKSAEEAEQAVKAEAEAEAEAARREREEAMSVAAAELARAEADAAAEVAAAEAAKATVEALAREAAEAEAAAAEAAAEETAQAERRREKKKQREELRRQREAKEAAAEQRQQEEQESERQRAAAAAALAAAEAAEEQLRQEREAAQRELEAEQQRLEEERVQREVEEALAAEEARKAAKLQRRASKTRASEVAAAAALQTTASDPPLPKEEESTEEAPVSAKLQRRSSKSRSSDTSTAGAAADSTESIPDPEEKPASRRRKSRQSRDLLAEEMEVETAPTREPVQTTAEPEETAPEEPKPRSRRQKSRASRDLDQPLPKEEETATAGPAPAEPAPEEVKPKMRRRKSRQLYDELLAEENSQTTAAEPTPAPIPAPAAQTSETLSSTIATSLLTPSPARRKSRRILLDEEQPAETASPADAAEEKPMRSSRRRNSASVNKEAAKEEDTHASPERRSRRQPSSSSSSTLTADPAPPAVPPSPTPSKVQSSLHRVRARTEAAAGYEQDDSDEDEPYIPRRLRRRSEGGGGGGVDLTSPVRSTRRNPSTSLQSPVGQNIPELHTLTPVAATPTHISTTAAASLTSPPAVIPRPTLFSAIRYLQVSQLRLLLSTSPHVFHQSHDNAGRTIGDMLWQSVRENGADHPALQEVLEVLIKQRVHITFSPFDREQAVREQAAAGAGRGVVSPPPLSDPSLDELVYLDVQNDLLSALAVCYERVAAEEQAMNESLKGTVAEVQEARDSQMHRTESLRKQYAQAQQAHTKDSQTIQLAQIQLDKLSAELASLRAQERAARQEVLLLQGKLIYRDTASCEDYFEQRMLELHKAELTSQIRAGEVAALTQAVEEHRSMAEEAQKELRRLEEEKKLSLKQGEHVLLQCQEAEQRVEQSIARLQSASDLLQAAADERHKHFQVTLSLFAHNLGRRLFLRRPNPFVRIYRLKAGHAPKGEEELQSAEVLASLAANPSAWEPTPCAQTPLSPSTSDPTWPPLRLSLFDLIGGDRRQPFRLECWSSMQPDKMQAEHKGMVPLPTIEVELLGVTVCTLAQIEKAAAAQGVTSPSAALSPSSASSPFVFSAPFSCNFSYASFELLLSQPGKSSKKGGIYIQSIQIEEV